MYKSTIFNWIYTETFFWA